MVCQACLTGGQRDCRLSTVEILELRNITRYQLRLIMIVNYSHLKLTIQETRIVNYINTHSDSVLRMSAEALAEVIFTSPATINRFACKLGYKGFADFKLHYALDYQSLHANQVSTYQDFNTSADPADYLLLMHEFLSAEHKKLSITQNTIFNKIIDVIKSAGCIDIYATGRNYHLAMVAADKLLYAGIKVIVFNNVEQDHYDRFQMKDRVCFILSRTGENPTCLYAANTLRSLSAKIIGITGRRDSSLISLCDHILPLHHVNYHEDINKIIDTFSINWIFDYIYLALLKKRD